MARVHGSRTHHGTQSAPSAVLKTEDITGCLALSCAFPNELERRVYLERRSRDRETPALAGFANASSCATSGGWSLVFALTPQGCPRRHQQGVRPQRAVRGVH